MMKAERLVLCVVLTAALMGCAMFGPGSAESLDAETARQIASLVETVVAGDMEAELLPDSVGSVTIRLPAVMAAIESRRNRFASCARYKELNCIGENREGLAEYRKCDACQNRGTRNLVYALIVAENDDRWSIYEGIVKSNHLGRSARKTLQQSFRAEHEARASSGELYQTPEGEWRSKL